MPVFSRLDRHRVRADSLCRTLSLDCQMEREWVPKALQGSEALLAPWVGNTEEVFKNPTGCEPEIDLPLGK